uniref:Uncharacterized protein n=1 Tax=Molossus molossus TaxID=27622 RepID=A0A7J8BYG7_MOLMO|nr:hypothetical protein HJG59_010043 [Molossus molossus]
MNEDTHQTAGRGQGSNGIGALAILRARDKPASPVITGQKGLWLSDHPTSTLRSAPVRVLCWGMDLSQVLEGACCIWPSPQTLQEGPILGLWQMQWVPMEQHKLTLMIATDALINALYAMSPAQGSLLSPSSQLSSSCSMSKSKSITFLPTLNCLPVKCTSLPCSPLSSLLSTTSPPPR